MLAANREYLTTRHVSAGSAKKPVGALVIGGDYQGLGIARSLGRHNVPVCVIDDEISIARFSRYTTHSVKVPSLREEKETAEIILDLGHRLDLRGWVVYPTRDETVAALSRYRPALAEFFRLPTPAWETVKWVWDKRNTYRLANELGLATPATWYGRSTGELPDVTANPPFAIKPAIKEHFI